MTDELKLCPFHNCNTCGCYEDVDIPDKEWNKRPIEDALRAELAALREQKRWIPVGERLPEDGEEVIVALFYEDAFDVWEGDKTAKKLENNDVIVSICAYRHNGKWLMGPREEIDEAYAKITHWRPLPEPPEGE